MCTVARTVKTATSVTICNRTRKLVRATEEVLTQIKAAAAVSSGLMINERKTKYASKSITDLEKHLIMDGQVWEGFQNLRFLGTVTNSLKSFERPNTSTQHVQCSS